MRFIATAEIRRRLTYELCIATVRQAMMDFSAGRTVQLLRSIVPLEDNNLFAVMPGGLGGRQAFGAKIVSVFHANVAQGGKSHQGVVVLFDGENGRPICIAEAGEITAIRTASASAVATDVLARPDAGDLAILGTGDQAQAHARAIAKVRALRSITVWGRRLDRAQACASALSADLGRPVSVAPDARMAVAGADIICTVSGASEPILQGAWVRPGAHINVVGSSFAGPAEIDEDLVAGSRFIADSREGVLKQGAEFLRAKANGRIDDSHVVGEIGQVLNGELVGREHDAQITIYKSLGHVVQDLAAVVALHSLPPLPPG